MREIPVHVLDPATGEDRRFASLKDLPFPETWPRGGAFTVSPDGQTILYTTFVSRGADLMLIENFK